MTDAVETTIRPATEAEVGRLAEREPQTALLAEKRTIFLVADRAGVVVGFAFGYLLPRRHGEPEILFVYEIDVDPAHREQGIGRRLMEELIRRGGAPAFVLTEPGNDAANALYRSLGGTRTEAVMWDFAAL